MNEYQSEWNELTSLIDKINLPLGEIIKTLKERYTSESRKNTLAIMIERKEYIDINPLDETQIRRISYASEKDAYVAPEVFVKSDYNYEGLAYLGYPVACSWEYKNKLDTHRKIQQLLSDSQKLMESLESEHFYQYDNMQSDLYHLSKYLDDACWKVNRIAESFLK